MAETGKDIVQQLVLKGNCGDCDRAVKELGAELQCPILALTAEIDDVNVSAQKLTDHGTAGDIVLSRMLGAAVANKVLPSSNNPAYEVVAGAANQCPGAVMVPDYDEESVSAYSPMFPPKDKRFKVDTLAGERTFVGVPDVNAESYMVLQEPNVPGQTPHYIVEEAFDDMATPMDAGDPPEDLTAIGVHVPSTEHLTAIKTLAASVADVRSAARRQ